MQSTLLPVAVIGAGPVGLAAAAHILATGEEPIVFESGPSVGTSLLEWGHVKLFSPWRYVVDEASAALLTGTGWQSPDPETYPTGRELVEKYLEPLAAMPELQSRIRFNTHVARVTRDGFDKMKTEGREDAPFLLSVRNPDGHEEQFLAKAVVDASGTYQTPNPLGAAGLPALGESALQDRIVYGIPDVLGGRRSRYSNRRVLVLGSGHSAFNVLLDLVELAESAPETEVIWAVRRDASRLQNLFGGGANDRLPARGELGAKVQHLVEQGRLKLVTGFKVARLTDTADGIIVAGQDEVLPPVDEIIAATGFRPDLSVLAELRLNLDSTVESPAALAPLIDPNVHSCGSVPPHGAEELRHPEADVYVVGMKSYGRAPTFLLLTGYEQVRSVASAIAGDWASANDVRLVLPETGVCSTNILADRGVDFGDAEAADLNTAASCCGPVNEEVVVSSSLIKLSVAAPAKCCG